MNNNISVIPLTVTQLNNQVKSSLQQQYQHLNVVGEINNLKKYSSGHVYFILKDESSEISCVMFNNNYKQLNMDIKNGDKVVLSGDATLYLPKGNYQFSTRNIKLFNEKGDIYKRYEELKKKLESEGLFKAQHKKKIPKFPSTIGVITSLDGSVIKDIINISQRRSKSVDLVISPSPVQGESAHKHIVKAIDKLIKYNKKNTIDVIIVARGGGSFEDLNCFNNKELARKVFELKIPIISGVGHETDFTIIDFVSDMRASTPSEATELAVSDDNETVQTLDLITDKILNQINVKLNQYKEHYNDFNRKIMISNPSLLIENYKIQIIAIREKIINIYKVFNKNWQNKIKYYDKLLHSNNPYNILNRGFTVVLNQNGKLIKKIKDVDLDEKISIKFYDGLAVAQIKSKDYKNEKKEN